MKKVALKGVKLLTKKDLVSIIGGIGYPGQCIRDAQEVGLDPRKTCCPGCNAN